MKITIGEAGGKGVGFDLDTLLVTRLLIQANSGAGKSWLLRKLIEQLYGHVQVIVIDPEGEFATLRKKYDFVLVGAGGETPADVRSAAMLAEKLLELKASAVCDLYEMKPSARHLWVKEFLESMVNAPKKLWHPCVVIVDEAQLFCPQDSDSVAEEAMVSLTTRGRKRGFCAVWATQRLAKVNKDATAMLLNRLVGGTFEDVDIKRALDLLSVPAEEKRSVSQELKTMEPGMFFAFGRAITKNRLLFKVGAVETPHPQAGSAKHSAAPPPAPEKIRGLLPQLADLPHAAEQKAHTIEDLQRELRTAKTQLAAAERIKTADPAEVKDLRSKCAELERGDKQLRSAMEDAVKIVAQITAKGFEGTSIAPEELQSAFERASAEIVKIAEQKLQQRAKEFDGLQREARNTLRRLQKLLEMEDLEVSVEVQHNKPFTVTSAPPRKRAEDLRSPRGSEVAAELASTNGDLSNPQKRILGAVAQFAAIGRPQVPKKWIAALAGVSHSSGSFGNNLGYLRSNGYIDYPGTGIVALTQKGHDRAPQVDPPATPQEMVDRCKEIVSGPQARILDVLAERYPKAIDKQKIAELVGVSATSGSFGNNLGALRSAGMIEYPEMGKAQASSWLLLDDAR